MNVGHHIKNQALHPKDKKKEVIIWGTEVIYYNFKLNLVAHISCTIT